MGESSIKLNLGGGLRKIPGYQNIDRKLGTEVYPLREWADNSVDEIRASHILEHFSHREIEGVLSDWVRALKPGGLLRVAVPDFDYIVKAYSNGHRDDPLIQGYLFGGQTDENDFHKALFDKGRLQVLLEQMGLVEIGPWQSEINDAASLPVSLNLMGRKATIEEIETPQLFEVKAKVSALTSIPRLGFQAHWGVVQKAFRCGDFDIPIFKFTGAFWEQHIQNGLSLLIDKPTDWVITLDYDSIFDSEDVKELLFLAARYPEADAIVPWQVKRGKDQSPLFSIVDQSGQIRRSFDPEEFSPELTQIQTGHFGLTLIKTAALKKIPKPWFWSQPNPDTGDWDDKRIDADIYFWKKFKESGCKVFVANDIRIGHIDEEIFWMDKDFQVVRQTISDFNENGKPEGCR